MVHLLVQSGFPGEYVTKLVFDSFCMGSNLTFQSQGFSLLDLELTLRLGYLFVQRFLVDIVEWVVIVGESYFAPLVPSSDILLPMMNLILHLRHLLSRLFMLVRQLLDLVLSVGDELHIVLQLLFHSILASFMPLPMLQCSEAALGHRVHFACCHLLGLHLLLHSELRCQGVLHLADVVLEKGDLDLFIHVLDL